MPYESVILDDLMYGGLPFAYYPLDEANGTAAADLMLRAKGTNNAGAYVNSPTLDVRPGPINREPGGWVTLNGTTQYCNVGTLGNLGSSLGNGLTVECWLKTSVTNVVMRTIGVNNLGGNPSDSTLIQFALNRLGNGTTSAGYIYVTIKDKDGKTLLGTSSSTTTVCDGNPHHLVCTALGSTNTITIYLDGVSLPVTYTLQQTPTLFTNFVFNVPVGAIYSGGLLGYFSGSLSQFKLWNYILSASRVQAHYWAGLHGTPDLRRLAA